MHLQVSRSEHQGYHIIYAWLYCCRKISVLAVGTRALVKRAGNIYTLCYETKNAAPDVGLEPTTLGLLEHDWLAM